MEIPSLDMRDGALVVKASNPSLALCMPCKGNPPVTKGPVICTAKLIRCTDEQWRVSLLKYSQCKEFFFNLMHPKNTCIYIHNKANLRDLIAVTALVILLKLDSNHRFFSPCELEIWWMTSKMYRVPLLHYIKFCASPQTPWWIQTGVTVQKSSIRAKISNVFRTMWSWNLMGWPSESIGHLFYAILSFVHHFKATGEFKLEFQSRNTQFGSKLGIFLSRVTLIFDGWPWKTIRHLFYVASSFMHHFVNISEFNLKLQSGNAQFGSKSANCFALCDLEIWRMTLKNHRAPLLSNIKLYASFHDPMWIQTGVTVRKRLRWVMTSVTLTFDVWP